MEIATRFGMSKSQFRKSISVLNSTQLISLLALPAGEEEKFIADKVAAGTPVQDILTEEEINHQFQTIAHIREILKECESAFLKYRELLTESDCGITPAVDTNLSE